MMLWTKLRDQLYFWESAFHAAFDMAKRHHEHRKEWRLDEFSQAVARGAVQGFAQFYQKLLVEGPTVWQSTKTQ